MPVMRMPWRQTKPVSAMPSSLSQTDFFEAMTTGEPLLVSVALLDEDSGNPRTEFPDADLDELAEDIRQHGVLQPIDEPGQVDAARQAGCASAFVARGIGQLRAAGEVGIADRDGALGRRLQLGRETRC